jgi:hypothetical protein
MYVHAAARRVCAAIGRAVAAHRALPMPPPYRDSALAELTQGDVWGFKRAEEALGDAEYPPTVDAADSEFYEAKWIKLKHSHRAGYGRYGSLPEFSFGHVATPEDLREYIRRNEEPIAVGEGQSSEH